MQHSSLRSTTHRRRPPKSALGVEVAIFFVSLIAAAGAVDLFGSQFLRANAAGPILEARCIGQASQTSP